MITTLSQKFKDRDPSQTIENIKKFFSDNNFSVIVEKEEITEVGTYWCGLTLWFKDYKVCRSNGKGTSKIYALASGYAELYERFCAGFGSFNSDFLYKKLLYETNYINYNYNYHPNEKYDSFENIRNCCDKAKQYFSYVQDSNNFLFKINNLALKDNDKHTNSSIVVPYINLITNDEKYFSPFLIDMMEFSNGIAAGNTIEEAIVQGLSEVYEHYTQQLIYNQKQSIYYALNIEKLNLSSIIYDYINKIKELGYCIYIYDLSYNYNMPVIMTVLIDKKNHTWTINLGSHPVIDIAIERTITEVYQGYISLQNRKKITMAPGKNVIHSILPDSELRNISSATIYPDEILTNVIFTDSYNKDMFLEKNNYSNEELKNHLIKIAEKNNFNLFYYDLSLDNNIKTVRVFIDNIILFQINGISKIAKYNQELDLFLNNYYNIFVHYNLLIDQNYCNHSQLMNQLYLLEQHISNNKDLENLMIFSNVYIYFLPSVVSLQSFYFTLKKDIEQSYNLSTTKEKFFYFFNLFQYAIEHYTIEEIQYIFKILNYDTTKIINDYNNSVFLNLDFLFQTLILEEYKELYNYFKNNNFIKPFCKRR